ncbi:hypothetical protein M3172_12470 [Mesobacillus subterraneus]|uniref:hypothetical protein n=1 Tax=Mesobacillus subterraneus TaxID=285983 RepID=UPI002041E654|nr:hypothetical protein [Mesobacillus subterraneus]MCM3574004.1 hypothetical protein [Mesobacillus subterraneus]
MSNKIQTEMNKIEIPKELSERSRIGIGKAKTEIGKSNNKKWLAFAAPGLAAIIALGIAGPGLLSNQPPENPVIQTVQTSHAFDVTDPQRLVGWADNVFVGKVIKMSGTSEESGMLETQFKVEVAETIKGELQGEVTVNQQGGYEGKKLILVENDQLLKEGESYLFISRNNEEHDWHTVVPVYGDILINSEAHKEELLTKYEKAYQEEIPFE